MPELNPGHGYVIKERLGKGKWKEAYRAVYRNEWHDRALLKFIDPPPIDRLIQELRILIQHPPENVARLYDLFTGADGHVYVAEELLYRPLEALCPLRNTERFLRIARDLYTGLANLHELTPPMVHRDLKLDNCGIDYTDRAKIFDLGSATSEGGEVAGTTLTRAPELFKPGATCQKESDVWALGALLFALRAEDYPFVDKALAKNRRHLAGERRERFDEAIRTAAQSPDAESHLGAKVASLFPEGPRELLLRMLAFDPTQRPTAREAAKRWSDLVSARVKPAAPLFGDAEENAGQRVANLLRAVVAGEAGISGRQWQNVADFMKGEPKVKAETRAEILGLMEQVQNLRIAPPD